jgi:uncharacterized membrane protein
MAKPKPPLSPQEEVRLIDAIADAEKGHRGEIRVHFGASCPGKAIDEAKRIFATLPKTLYDTAVVLYIAPTDHKVAVWAGRGVHGSTESEVWQAITSAIARNAKSGSLIDGLEEALEQIRQVLLVAAPGPDVGGNELGDAPSYD